MNKKELEAFAKQAAKSIKTEADLTDFRRMLTKVMRLTLSLMNILVMPKTNNLIAQTRVMATLPKLFALKMVRFILIHQETANPVLNLS